MPLLFVSLWFPTSAANGRNLGSFTLLRPLFRLPGAVGGDEGRPA